MRIAGTLIVLALLATLPLAAGPEVPLAAGALAPVGGVQNARIAAEVGETVLSSAVSSERPPRLASDGHSVVAAYVYLADTVNVNVRATWFPTSALGGGVDLDVNGIAADVAWNGSAYVLVASYPGVNAYTITPDGTVMSKSQIDGFLDATSLSLACNGERCLAAFDAPKGFAVLFDRAGRPLAGRIPLGGDLARLAWDGRNFLAAVRTGRGPFDVAGARITPDGGVAETFTVSASALNDAAAVPTTSGVFVYRRQTADSGVHQLFSRAVEPPRVRAVRP